VLAKVGPALGEEGLIQPMRGKVLRVCKDDRGQGLPLEAHQVLGVRPWGLFQALSFGDLGEADPVFSAIRHDRGGDGRQAQGPLSPYREVCSAWI